MTKEINVHIGEVRVAKGGETLKALLGSCVGIGIIWKAEGICGLAHCLLPEAPTRSFTITGRFVDQAIPSLLAMMKVREDDYPEIEVVVAGGGNMTGPSDSGELVGTNNFKVAERELKRLGLKTVLWDVGGDEGRRIVLHGSNGTYEVEKIPRIINVS